MLKVLAGLILIPVAAGLTWLALGSHEHRADFVLGSEEPRTLDPQRVSWISEIQLTSAMFEGLTRLDPLTLQPVPAAAVSWKTNERKTQYRFHLRPNMRWSNGLPLSAQDFQFAWFRVLDPRTSSQYASLLFVIEGAESYYRSRLDADASDDLPQSEVGIRAMDTETVEVTLRSPCPYFLELTAFPTFAPVSRSCIEPPTHGSRGVSAARDWVRPDTIVCNGAFLLKEWTFKNRILLNRNPNYWDNDATGLNSVEVVITADPNVLMMGYQTGRIDLVRSVPTSLARVLRADQTAGRRSDFHSGDRFSTYFFRVNCKRPPLDNADLRKALSLAIDRTALCEHVMGAGETPAVTYVPRSAISLMRRSSASSAEDDVLYSPPSGLGAGLDDAQRVKLAVSYLQKSGFGRLAASHALKLAYSPNPDQQRVAEAVQAMWERNLKITVELQRVEGKVLSSDIRDLNYDIVRSDWYGDYLDPGTFLDMFTAGNGQNRTGWSNAEYDRLVAAAANEPDNRKRFDLFSQAEKILCEEQVPIIPLFFKSGNYLLNPHFSGVADNIRDILPIQRIRRAE